MFFFFFFAVVVEGRELERLIQRRLLWFKIMFCSSILAIYECMKNNKAHNTARRLLSFFYPVEGSDNEIIGMRTKPSNEPQKFTRRMLVPRPLFVRSLNALFTKASI